MSNGHTQALNFATMDAVDPDVVVTSILPSLDGPSLASISCASTTFRNLLSANSYHLWSHACHARWPSLNSPRLRHVVSTFPPDGPRSFFAQCYGPDHHQVLFSDHGRVMEFISAVDILYKGDVIFSKAVETVETGTSWFRYSPFRVDLVDQKDHVVLRTKSTLVKHPKTEHECNELLHDMTLNWILIDPIQLRAANLSSGQPISVQRHWLSGDAIMEFSSIIESSSSEKDAGEMVKCGIRLTLGGSESGGEMQVREVSLMMEDMDGKLLNGEGSLVILKRALEGNKGKKRRRVYEEFLERRRERKERRVRREERLDLFCMGLGVTLLTSFLMFLVFG